MKGLNVKSTMLDRALEIIAPHHCCGCEKTGTLLCSECKYYISDEPFSGCIGCLAPTGVTGVCRTCKLPYDAAWCVGLRHDSLETLINQYKFTRTRGAHRPLTELLDMVVPELPPNTVVVPIPTISRHIRQRGYDHMALIAREFARQRGVQYVPLLSRREQTVQLGMNKARRRKQAAKAFRCDEFLDADRQYVVIDDVCTTGATMEYAARVLRAAGAHRVSVAVISRQVLG